MDKSLSCITFAIDILYSIEMNTTQKGNELEARVYDILEPIVGSGRYGAYSKLYRHKKYYSHDTETYKIMDVSVETFDSPEDDTPMFIYIFECKNYSHKVDISDVEEFNTKLDGISYRAIKGAVVSTVGFTEPTIRLAQKKQIALIKISNKEEFDYVIKREVNDFAYYNHSLDVLGGEDMSSPILVYDDFKFMSLLDSLEANHVQISNDKILNVPFLKNEEIEKKTIELIPTNLQNLTNTLNIAMEYLPDIHIECCDLPCSQLGKLVVKDKLINISNELEYDTPRWRFTVAHEIGHYILHYEYLKTKIDSYGETSDSLNLSQCSKNNFSKRLEIQANKFAAYLLVPHQLLIPKIIEMFVYYGINRGRLFVDMQQCNLDNYHNVIGKIAAYFNVSKLCVAYRMKELNLLEITDDALTYIS